MENRIGYSICLLLENISRGADGHTGPASAHSPAALLYYMGQLVGEQLPPAPGAGVVLTPPEKDVPAGSERPRIELLIERICLRVSVHAHVVEIVAKPLAILRTETCA